MVLQLMCALVISVVMCKLAVQPNFSLSFMRYENTVLNMFDGKSFNLVVSGT